MKKMMMALALALMLPVCGLAEENIRMDGTIEAVRTQTIVAPHSGRVGDFSVRVGDEVNADEAMFTISAEKIYADFDGTITGVFAQPGDNASAVQARFGGLCWMEQDILYIASCTTARAANENEFKMVHVGEEVYVCSTNNKDRKGEAVVTSVEGKTYTLELTSFEDIRLGESIEVYRDDRHSSSQRIGAGTVRRVDPMKVTANGYVRAVHVQDGQKVSRGDLLFEMVPDKLEDMQGSNGQVRMPVDGVVLSVLAQSGTEVAKDMPMATFCQKEDMQLVCSVDEEDLAYLVVGMNVNVTLDAYRDEQIVGTVTKIAGASAQGGNGTNFDVTIALEDVQNIRVGMNATAETVK